MKKGTVLLKVSSSPDRWQSFGVELQADGVIRYYAGESASTADRWVILPDEYHARITWEADNAG